MHESKQSQLDWS